jgi:5-methylcytosine-specific restriction enzyme A
MPKRASAAQRGYGEKWRLARLTFLRHNPWCRLHRARGERVPATVVDHIKPHRGDRRLFWDKENWQGLCEHCHNSTKRAMELQGAACDASGYPADARHHWNRRS